MPKRKITAFNFQTGRVLSNKYQVIRRLGGGWEGEVYLVREISTGIERTAKFFFPERNPNNRALNFYAKKLHKLRHCPILIQYHTQDTIRYRGNPIDFLVSEYVDGEILTQFVERQRYKRLGPFQALHLLYALADGMEAIHQMGDYHGDLHSDNIIVQRFGLGFDLKVLDFIEGSEPKPANIKDDVVELIRIFYEALGGAKTYSKQPPEIKNIVMGLKRTLICKKFKSAGQLKEHLKLMHWS